jgi:hypothetical protein
MPDLHRIGSGKGEAEGAMKQISDYEGGLLNHLNLSYRAGDRPLALELVQALGLTAIETPITETMSLIAAHPNAEDLDSGNNVIFLLELPPHQAELEAVIERKAASDPELAHALESCRERARSRPDRGSHFGVRCTSNEALDSIVNRLETGLSSALKARVCVVEMPPHEPVAGFANAVRQVFVHTDVVTTGATGLGQNIELQAVRG